MREAKCCCQRRAHHHRLPNLLLLICYRRRCHRRRRHEAGYCGLFGRRLSTPLSPSFSTCNKCKWKLFYFSLLFLLSFFTHWTHCLLSICRVSHFLISLLFFKCQVKVLRKCNTLCSHVRTGSYLASHNVNWVRRRGGKVHSSITTSTASTLIYSTLLCVQTQ